MIRGVRASFDVLPLLVATALFGITKKGATRWLSRL